MREREVKLSAAPTFVMPDLTRLGEDLRVAIEEPLRTQTTYLDTDDLRLARAGASLRLRNGEGWTVKLPGDTSNGVVSRPEYTFPVESATPPPEARELTLAYTRGERLAPAARLRTVRRRVAIDDPAGGRLLEVDDDEVTVLGDHGRVAARFRELEVEFTEQAPPDLVDATVYLLREAGAGDPDAESKYVHVLGPRARQAPDVTVEPLSARPTAAEVIRAALARGTADLIRYDPVLRRDEDVEGVHQMRVAARKLRSHLRAFRTLLEPGWADELRDELGWLGGALGATRDADVMLLRLRDRIASSPNPDPAAPLVAHLEAERREALDAVLADMRSDRYVALLDALVEAQRAPRFTDEAFGPAERLLEPLEANWVSLHHRRERSGKHPSEDELHRLRVHAKRCRYGAELLEPVFGKPARDGARAAEKLQSVLGERHDAIVFRTWLHDRAVESTNTAAAFAAGEFAGEELVGLRSTARDWRKAYKRFAKVREPSRWRR